MRQTYFKSSLANAFTPDAQLQGSRRFPTGWQPVHIFQPFQEGTINKHALFADPLFNMMCNLSKKESNRVTA